MLPYLLAQPVARFELLLGKFAGLSGALLACLALGLGACSLVLALKGVRTSPASIVWLCGLSLLLALGMLSVGLLISALARKASVAVGTAIFVWLTLVFVSDLALMAGAVALRMRIEHLFGLSLANPLQVFKMWSLHVIDASLDVLGPAGLYAFEEYGGRLHVLFASCMLAWIIIPLIGAAIALSRRSPL
jgi:Cu-processing system permease protein